MLQINLMQAEDPDVVHQLDVAERARQKELRDQGMSKWHNDVPVSRLEGQLPRAAYVVVMVNK